jgi:hypothetical protein
MVKIRVLECYIVNADPDSVPRYQTRNLLIDIGSIDRLIREWIKDESKIEKITEAEDIFDTLPDLGFFEGLPRTGTDDFFFEGIVSMVRTAVLSLQSCIHIEKNKN